MRYEHSDDKNKNMCGSICSNQPRQQTNDPVEAGKNALRRKMQRS